MSSVAASLASAQQGIIRYGFPIFLALGNIGNLLSIAVFSQKHHRQNSCSLYLLAATIVSIIGVNWGLGTNMNAIYRPPDPFAISLFLCRIRGYILQVTSLLYKIMVLLACVDRFALTSTEATIRAFSKPKVALKMIGGTTLFSMLISIHLPIFETIENNRCSFFGTYGLFFSIYLICIFGLILPISTMFFGFLIMKNLKTIRARVQPLPGTDNVPRNVLSKRDITLIKLVFAEVLIGILLTSLYPINSLYSILASNVPNKSLDRIAIESFMTFFALTLLFYLNYCVTFYLYITISKAFRQEIKRLFLKCIKRPEQEQRNAISVAATQKQRADHV